MKSFIFILNLYFLFLTVIPCHCEAIVSSFEYKTEISSLSHTNEDLQKDICTPFCVCAGVHNPSFIAKVNFNFQNVNFTPVKKFAIYNENQISSYLDTLWRPPQA